MTTPLYHLLLAGASLAAILLTPPEDIRRASASGAAAGRSGLSPMRARPYLWPTGAAAAFRSLTPRRAARWPSTTWAAAWLTWRCSRGTGVCWPSMKHRSELLLLDYHDRAVRVLDRLKVSPDPVRLALLAGGASCAVASLWSRQLTFVSIAKGTGGRRHGPRVHRRSRAAVLPAGAGQLGRRLEAGGRRRVRRAPGGGRYPSPGDRIGSHDPGAQHPRDGLRTRRANRS